MQLYKEKFLFCMRQQFLYAFTPSQKPCSDGNSRSYLRKVYILYVRLILYMEIFQFKPRILQWSECMQLNKEKFLFCMRQQFYMLSLQAKNPAVMGIHAVILQKVYILYVRLVLYMYMFQFKPRILQWSECMQLYKEKFLLCMHQ